MTLTYGLALGLLGTTLTVIGFTIALYIGTKSLRTKNDSYKNVPEAIRKTIKELNDTRRP